MEPTSKAAGRLLMERIPHLFWTPCAAHCLDLLLEDIGKIKEFNTCINMAKKLHKPLLVALRIADGDETPAALEIMAAMDHAKAAIKDSLKDKPNLLKEVLEYFDKRWENQMERRLYGAALYLNPSKYFAIREKDRRQATKLRIMFNQVMWKMVSDDEDQNKISKQADDYERSEGQSFSKPGAIRDRDRKNPILWWGAYGGLTYELQCLAKMIVSLCCSRIRMRRNWSEFSLFHEGAANAITWANVDDAIGATRV
ncbi:unnamed protein product [Miscanthus lutarioriparius]|uniref:DUF659 domain-containing protein n=1 Tax=Miscanthus lutarioriparius TaxID=422564 RepID=A0A811QXQ0_9POAL|nr:unnamed protein product [Miscanthus lutarioriparius]